jgi:hypothetical protein
MRTTVRIDDDLLRLIRDQAHRDGVSVGQALNRIIRRGMEIGRRRGRHETPAYAERVFSMGRPAVDLTKALGLAARLEDEETLEKQARRK